jgi:carboxypeptidase Taq
MLNNTVSLLSWDQETYMPEAAVDYRAEMMSFHTMRSHRLVKSKEMFHWLAAAEDDIKTKKELRNLEELRYSVDRACCIPQKLVKEESLLIPRAKASWVKARAQGDFLLFVQDLEKIIKISRQKAECWGYDQEPYDALLGTYERDVSSVQLDKMFARLKPKIEVIAQQAVTKSSSNKLQKLPGKYPVHEQQRFNESVARSIGFDYQRGRIDSTAHPFCTRLGPKDIRLTTRYDESDFTSSLFGVLHEAGHGLYEQGLPVEDFGLPSGAAVSLGIHESQSRLWENHVGRSLSFWQKWFPTACECFPALRKVQFDDFMQYIWRAKYSSIRVESDEVTYDLHILLRFKIERALINGELKVNDIDAYWNESFEKSFGFKPKNAAQGCLQDIHWSMGLFGYFATYTLGNLNAAQLFQQAIKDKTIAKEVNLAEYGGLLQWLKKEVHQHGCLLSPNRLMAQATGSKTEETAYLKHLNLRYSRGL